MLLRENVTLDRADKRDEVNPKAKRGEIVMVGGVLRVDQGGSTVMYAFCYQKLS